MEYSFQNNLECITDKDVARTKKGLRERIKREGKTISGDKVWVEVEQEEFIGGQFRKRIAYKKREVIKKYRNLVEVQSTDTRRVTLSYKEILINDLKRKKKMYEGSMV